MSLTGGAAQEGPAARKSPTGFGSAGNVRCQPARIQEWFRQRMYLLTVE